MKCKLEGHREILLGTIAQRCFAYLGFVGTHGMEKAMATT